MGGAGQGGAQFVELALALGQRCLVLGRALAGLLSLLLCFRAGGFGGLLSVLGALSCLSGLLQLAAQENPFLLEASKV
ncbi:hypothetical protein [Nonomuraea aurantiaca]|uniref:hypothetical protein n=1 Tax=Nonomuraea aurantiaca TaxID=2878562 RepID=UPI001CD94BE5|nr:hypothetical protein [Nonomuraea aurantiaca]MCA2226346.1 hypothetical protein [Nonomuraea aurantiaca]